MQKRNQQLHDQYTRLDIACSHAAEELASANSQNVQLRNERSNLRVEKKIWEVRSHRQACQLFRSYPRSRMCKFVYLTKTSFYLWNGHV